MKPIRTLPIRSTRLIAVCGKCGRKLGGGFGPDGDERLAKTLRRAVIGASGKRATVRIVETKCMDICPKHAVVLLDSAAAGKVMIVPERTPVGIVAEALAGDRPRAEARGQERVAADPSPRSFDSPPPSAGSAR